MWFLTPDWTRITTGCGETQTMSHIVESCPLTKLNGSLSRLHSADEDAVSWPTSYGSWHAYEKKKTTGFGLYAFLFCVPNRCIQFIMARCVSVSHHCTASNVATAERSWPTSCSSLASYHSCYQCNRWWLLSAGSDGCIRLQTGDNTFGVPMAVLCWHQLWSDTDSNRRPYLYLNIFFMWN